ncbi:hypothetical protein [Dyadobacter crusticola]|uniref:hypothetical protein n=1 Tax=Dyadobacter crusticola TaxID=292407 RepID=UPI000B27DA84|nr:hypothetical protein [Dyadobacter crusticola]
MNKTNKLFPVTIALIPILIWVLVILYYSVDLPWLDDFDPFPDFLHKWIGAPSLSEQVKLLFQPNNEHRMVVGKLVTLGYYWITGKLNFTFLHIAGACFTLGTLVIFWRVFRQTKLNIWYFLPIPFLLFQLQYHLVFLWAICSLQHQPVVLFVCSSMYLLANKRFTLAALSGLCATYAMSSGIFVWPAGIMVLLLSGRYKQLAVWCLIAVAGVGLYFYGMSAQGNESSFEFFAKYPHLSFLGFFAFLGGLFDLFPEKSIQVRTALPILMSFLIMVWIVRWLWRLFSDWTNKTFGWPKRTSGRFGENVENEYSPVQMFLLGVITFLLVNAIIIGLLRPRFGFFVMVVSNYKMYPALFLIAAYLTFITSNLVETRRKLVFRAAFGISMLIWIISAINYLPVISERSKYLTVNGYNQEFNGFGLGHVPFSAGAAYVDSLMKEMVEMGVYQYPAGGRKIAQQVNGPNAKQANAHILVKDEDKQIYINDPAGSISLSKDKGEYVFLKNPERTYLFKIEQKKYVGRNIFRQYEKGADIVIPYSSVLSGSYDIGIIRTDNTVPEGGILRKIIIP